MTDEKNLPLTMREAAIVAKMMQFVSNIPFGGSKLTTNPEDIQDAMNVKDKVTKVFNIRWVAPTEK